LTRWQKWRAGLGAAGVAVGLAGMALELRTLVWGAAGLLVPAFLLRFADRSESEASRAP
jgi:hypothetical protein